MRPHLPGAIDGARSEARAVTAAAVVDDIAMQRFGIEEKVADDLCAASGTLAQGLRCPGVAISSKKSKRLAGSTHLSSTSEARLTLSAGAAAAKAARNFGIDLSQ
eukprot:8241806-Pyramimonas_sp.AAC.1